MGDAATLVCGARSLMAHYANYMKSTGLYMPTTNILSDFRPFSFYIK